MVVNPAAIRAGAAYVELYTQDNRLVRGLASAQRKLRAFAQGASQIGRSMMVMSTMMALPFLAGTKGYADFEQSMANIATMLEEPQKFMGQFSKGIDELSRQFGISTDDLAKGLYDILSAQVPASRALEYLAASAKLAKGGNAEAADSISAMLTLLETYGDELRDAGDAADFLFAVVKRGRTNLGELAPQIGRVISVSKSAGLSLEDMGASLALITRATGETDMAITALSAISSELLKRTDAQAKTLRGKYGAGFNYAMLQAEGMLGVLKKMQALKPSEIAAIFPNVRAIRGIVPAIQKMEGFSDDLDQMRDRAGAAQEAFDKVSGTLSFMAARARESLRSIQRSIGESLTWPLKETGRVIAETTGEIVEWIKNNEEAVSKTAALVVIIGGLGAALTATAVAMQLASFTCGILTAAYAAVGTAVGLLATALTFLAAHPLVLVGVVLAGVVASFVDWGAVISSVTAKIWDMVPSMNELLGLTRKTAEQVAAEHAALAQKAKRLDELRQKTRWSNAEQAEARRLVADLHGAYPELARDIDALGTSAAATAQVMERMAEAMEESLAKVQNQELQKAVDELAALNKQMDYFKAAQEEIKYQEETWMPTAVVRDIMDKGYMEGGARRVRRLKEELKGMPALIQKIEEAQERVATLLAARARGEEERGPKGPAATARREDVSDDARAAQDAADFRERMLYRLCELRSQLIEDERDREIELIRQRYRQEIDEAKKAGRDTLLIEQARMLEIRAIKQRFAAQERVEAERRAEERKGMEEEIAADTERLIIESTKQGYAKQAALLELQRRQALERAKEMGVDPRAVEEQFALRHQLLQQKHAADQIEKRIGVAGTFNAWAAGRMGGGRNPQERTARAAEEMKDDIKRLVRKAEDGRLVFAD